MKEQKRIISPKGVLIFLCLTVIILAAGSQMVTAAQQKPYLIKVNRACNTITVYEQDEKGDYTVPIKAMVCSVGLNQRTVTGTYQTKEKYRWKLLMGDVWGQYATRIYKGILFHSVYYYRSKDPASLATAEYNKLGSAASHGCIRLTVEDAKWIYDNCSIGTTVVIYDDKKNPGPLGKPESVRIPSTVRWDPTDPSNDNPYALSLPVINGAADTVIEWGEEIDLTKGVEASSSLGADITPQLKVSGTVNNKEPGKYNITYTVQDELHRIGSKSITVTVKDCPADPEIVGVKNKLLVHSVDLITKEYALSGVEVYQGDKKLDKELIDVTIEKLDEDDYTITYKVIVNEKEATEQASVHIDSELPVMTGVKDFLLEEGELPSNTYLMEGITFSDNETTAEDLKVEIDIVENQDGTLLITYHVTDKAGNIATAQAKVQY